VYLPKYKNKNKKNKEEDMKDIFMPMTEKRDIRTYRSP